MGEGEMDGYSVEQLWKSGEKTGESTWSNWRGVQACLLTDIFL